jgi:hypothetical protein
MDFISILQAKATKFETRKAHFVKQFLFYFLKGYF